MARHQVTARRATSNVPISAATQAKIRCMVEQHGERRTLEMLGISKTGLFRALSGLPVTVLMRSHLALALDDREHVGEAAASAGAKIAM